MAVAARLMNRADTRAAHLTESEAEDVVNNDVVNKDVVDKDKDLVNENAVNINVVTKHFANDVLIEETPVALIYNQMSYAVMMATPADLLDYAVGISTSEAISSTRMDADTIQLVHRANGIECHMTLDDVDRRRLRRRLRSTQSSSACGLCGVKGLAQAVRVPDTIAITPCRCATDAVVHIMDKLRLHQPLHDRTHAAHAAAFIDLETGGMVIREDIGRHNALDKLGGALLRRDMPRTSGVLALTSRLSVDMVQKAAALNIPIIVTPSAPSTLAVRLAEIAQITLIGRVRNEHYTIYTHAARMAGQTHRALPEIYEISPSEHQYPQNTREGKRLKYERQA